MATILLTLDGSKLAEQAIPHALAQYRPGDRLVLLRVSEPHYHEPGSPSVTTLTDIGLKEAQTYLAEQTRALQEQGIEVKSQALVGLPRDLIVSVAAVQQADLIVMASHGWTGSRRWLLGSVAESVSRDAPCPVWLVRCTKDAPPPPQTERVLVALDTSELAEKGLDFAVDWLRKRPARLLLFSSSGIGPADAVWAPETEARVHVLEQARQYLEERVAQLRERGWQVDMQVHDGAAAQSILDAAAREQVDLIVLTTHGRTGLGRWFMGSVAEQVFRHAPCPVLLVNSQVKVACLR